MWLVTPTLLNSFDYYRNFEGETTEDDDGNVTTAEQKEAAVRADFIRTIGRKRSEPNEAMQAGIDFENRVSAYCRGMQGEDLVVQEIGDIVKGGTWQAKMKRPLDEWLLYAKADVIKRDTIYDIKRTKSYDLGKYQRSMQHRIEFFCTGLPKFAYLVSDERNWWREDYFNHSGIEQEIRAAIRQFTRYLENDAEAKALYYGNWESLEKAA